MARDNFPQSVIDKLRLRVGTRCSNPDCRRPTVAAAKDPEGLNNAGVAAHISAAAAGGPRYRADVTTKQRRSIENGIWLCALCGTMIDRDEASFPESLLRAWKHGAEEKARHEQGRQLPAPEDAAHLLATALTGLPHRYAPMAVTNVHKATVEALQSLDPRFIVTSEFKDGRSVITLAARQELGFDVQIRGASAKDFPEKYRRLVEYAEPARISANNLHITGSELLARIADDARHGGSFVISPPSRPATVKLTLSRGSALPAVCDEVAGTLSVGSSQFRFEGSGYGGVLGIQVRIRRIEGDHFEVNFSLQPDFSKWNDRELLTLPFFERVELLTNSLQNGGRELRFDLEVEGNHVLGGTNCTLGDPETISVWTNHIAYVRRARTLAGQFGLAIKVSSQAGFTAADHEALADAVDTIEGRRKYTRSQLKSPPVGTLRLNPAAKQEFEASMAHGALSDMMMVEKDREVLRVFGTQVWLPQRRLTITQARPRVLRRRTKGDSEELRVRWEMTEASECAYSYLPNHAESSAPTPHVFTRDN